MTLLIPMKSEKPDRLNNISTCITGPVYQDHFNHADLVDKKSLILAKKLLKEISVVHSKQGQKW